MAPNSPMKKRKAVTTDSSEADEVVLSDGADTGEPKFVDAFLSKLEGELDGIIGEESEVSGDLDIDEDGNVFPDEEEEDLDSDELELDSEESSEDGHVNDRKDPIPYGTTTNYTVTTDANGNERYIYQDIDTGYGTDDSDAPVTSNTIGNIPLSFYDYCKTFHSLHLLSYDLIK